MTAPTDMGRDQLAHTLHAVDAAVYPGIRAWEELSEDSRGAYLQLADVLLSRTIVMARTRGGPATASDYLAASTTEQMDQATHHAADSLRRARELGTIVYHHTSVTADDQALVQMLAQAWVSGHRTASHAAQGALEDIARLQAEADQAHRMMATVEDIVADVRQRAAEGRHVMVELPETAPAIDEIGPQWAEGTYPGSYYAESVDSDVIAIRALPDGAGRAYLTPDEVGVLVPQLLALARDRDQAKADQRAEQIARFAERAHVDLCHGTADEAAGCDDCQEYAAFFVDRWAAQEAADAA